MSGFFKSLYGKISAIFLALLVLAAILEIRVSVHSAMQFARETEQKLNHDLAKNLAAEFRPFLTDSIKYSDVEQTMHYLMVTNPHVEIYLISEAGEVLSFFAVPREKVKQAYVRTAPIRAFLADSSGRLILGDDPRNPGVQKAFSAAPITLGGGRPGYLYVILGGEQYDSAAGMLRESYILRLTAMNLAGVFLLTGMAGIVLFFFLTRRFSAMTATVRRFERGEYHRRLAATSDDEIGRLARAFNQMADTIVANMDELKRTDDLRRELVANVSHDLRSPLASIQGYLETIIMKDRTLSDDDRKKYLQILLKNTRMLNTLVDELFELSKLDARQIEPQIEPFSMAELTQDVAMKFQPLAKKLGVTMDTHLPHNLPPVNADIGLIERALSNLIDNALRYTPKNGRVRISLSQEKGGVFIRISDSGKGIPAEELPRIFERFYRLDKSRSRHSRGAGLGLAIAKKIIELHNSTIEVHSAPERGTTFSFALPQWPGGR